MSMTREQRCFPKRRLKRELELWNRGHENACKSLVRVRDGSGRKGRRTEEQKEMSDLSVLGSDP